MRQQEGNMENFLGGAGEMGRMIREFDWSVTTLGSVEVWPQSLKTTVRLMLNSRYPMFVWWGDELTILYNDASAPIFGKKHPTALGKPARQIWAEIWKDLAAQVDAVMRGGRASWNEEVLLFMERNGFPEEVYFTWSYSPIVGETGEVGGLFCACTEETSRVLDRRRLKTLRDLGERSLTEAKTAEQACHAAAVTLAENPNDFPFALIYLLNDDGRETRRCEVNGLPMGTKASPATIQIATEQDVWKFWRLIETGQTQIVENLEEKFGRLPAGAWTEDWTKRAIVLPLKKAGRQEHLPTGFLVAGLSPRLSFDDDYRSFLELAAKQLASAIANARAYEEERKRAKALAELDRAKTVFFSNISHEFRTPLTLMLGPVEDILSQPYGSIAPEDRRLLTVVQRNGLRLQKLVSTLLDFSRIEAGRIQAAYEPTDLSTLTAELASNFRSTCEKVGLSLVVRCDRLPDTVYVDRDMWEKIVLNLISNAFKYTLSGQIEVTLGQAGNAAELSVRDTGIGIDEHELPKIFQRFYRIESARGRTHEGTGIGLALVQELVKLHGGTITAESVYGAGSRFTVRIPIGSAHLPPEKIRAGDLRILEVVGRSATAYVEEALRWLPEESGETTSIATDHSPLITDHAPLTAYHFPVTTRPRVLVVDDNADMREYVRRLLASHYRVELLPNGEAALAAAKRQRPDLMIIDVMMPVMDGLALLRAIREDDNLKTVPIIMLSARALEEARVEALNAGADDYMVKPFSARELLARVESHLQLHRVRQETERALRQRTAQFETLLNAAPLGVYLVDRDFRIRQVNPTALPVFGDIPDLIGRDFDEVIHVLWPKAYADELVRRFRHTLETGEPYIVAERIEQRLDRGVIEYYEWQIHRIPLPDDVHGVVCYFRDISAQVAARQKIAESEERFRAIVSQMTAGITRADLSGKLLFVNQKLCEMLGYTETELIGKTVWELTFAEDLETNKTLFQRMAAHGEPFEIEKRLIRKDGALIWTIVSVASIRDASGKPQSTVAVVIETTARKRAEEALRDSEEKYRSLFESIDEGFCVAEMIFDDTAKPVDYRFLETNAVFERQTGLKNATGRTALELVPHLEQWWIDTYGKVALTGESVRFENNSAPMNRWFDVYASRVGPETSRKVAIVFHDISERKRADEALREADRRKDEFIAMLGHELRNPLGIISNAVHLLRRLGPPDPQLGDLREMIERQVTHTSRMLDDLLDVSRISRGKIHLDKQAWDLRDIVRQTTEDYQSTLDENGLRLELGVGEQPVRIIGDRTRLSQAIGNLLHNACKFTQPGGRVRVTLEADPQGYALLEVWDNGMGMEPDVLAWVFEPFSQADRSLDRSRGGLGLGLSLVKAIVELHGGTVGAVSDGMGRGSQFTVRLPLDQSQSRSAEARQNENTAGRSWRILIIEDNAVAARSTRLILETMGHTMEVAHNGMTGIEAARRFQPDVVLCDIGLPGLDGYGVASALRHEPGLQNSHLIAVSGYAQDERRAQEAGFNAHLLKPVDFIHLEQVLARLSTHP